MFTSGGTYQIWVMDVCILMMKQVKTWRVVTEVRELGKHGEGPSRQDTGGGSCWG